METSCRNNGGDLKLQSGQFDKGKLMLQYNLIGDKITRGCIFLIETGALVAIMK